MGFFTWTDAKFENPKENKRTSDYDRKYVVGYNKEVRLLKPDDTCIIEPCYDGYGMFGGHDIYDLVAEWNAAHFKEILVDMAANATEADKNAYPPNGIYDEKTLRPIMEAWQEHGETAAAETAAKIAENSGSKYLQKEWKRSIGICIACGDENRRLPFPLKVTTRKRLKYSEAFPSISTQ